MVRIECTEMVHLLQTILDDVIAIIKEDNAEYSTLFKLVCAFALYIHIFL